MARPAVWAQRLPARVAALLAAALAVIVATCAAGPAHAQGTTAAPTLDGAGPAHAQNATVAPASSGWGPAHAQGGTARPVWRRAAADSPAAIPSAAAAGSAQAGLSTDLPLVVIRTGGAPIVDNPKVDAWMGIVDLGPAARNTPAGPYNGYDGRIGIELRGSSSLAFPKNSFSVETREASGANRNVPLLGLPAENDWVLYAPYSDKSLMRNVLAFSLAHTMGCYASRYRFCEVIVDEDYRGVYVLMEKIKRDDSRVAVSRLDPDEVAGDDLTGGYIVKLDHVDPDSRGWTSPFAFAGQRLYYQYHDPAADELVPAQERYIQRFFGRLEATLMSPGYADPDTGYARYVDVAALTHCLLINELARNNDAYRLSTYMYKDRDSKGGRLIMGPVWDYNIAFGNVDYNVHPSVPLTDPFTQGLIVGNRFTWYSASFWFWWRRILQDQRFVAATVQRWQQLRQGGLRTTTLLARIDSVAVVLHEAQVRNFARWPVLGEYVWPNAFVGQTYAAEVDFLKEWITRRAEWLDLHLAEGLHAVQDLAADDITAVPGAPQQCTALASEAPAPYLCPAYPNPFNGSTLLRYVLPRGGAPELAVFTASGACVRRWSQGPQPAGEHVVRWDGCNLDGETVSSGVYIVRLEAGARRACCRVTVLR